MTRKIIIFLLCRKLGVKKFQPFRFVNQKSKTDYYMFNRNCLLKWVSIGDGFCRANVSLNWLLDDECEVKVCENNILDKGRVI